MTSLLNASSIPDYKIEFPVKITIFPVTGISDQPYGKKRDQFYLSIKTRELDDCISNLLKLTKWKRNWDGYDSEKPKENAIKIAKELLKNIFVFNYRLNLDWNSPNISADSCGDIVLEWWGKKDRKVTIYISEDINSIEYIKSLNAIVQDMEQDTVEDFNLVLCQKLFGWLG